MNNRPIETQRQQPPAVWKVMVCDLLVAACVLVFFAYFHHVREISIDAGVGFEYPSDSLLSEVLPEDNALVSGSDASEIFTDDIISTEDSYSSPGISARYYSGFYYEDDTPLAQYHVADIYVKDISCLRSVFAEDTYGRGIAEETLDAAVRTNAVCSINGDYYGTSTQNLIIRNGRLYGNYPKGSDICVLYSNGIMTAYSSKGFDAEQAIADGAWQAWSFGPSLLNGEGCALERFQSSVKGNHPRSVIGYYEPGHYCFIAVDGRREDSVGLTLRQLAKLCEELGLSCAYNLDGGQTSVMTFGDRIVNVPYKGGRACSDFLVVCEQNEMGE